MSRLPVRRAALIGRSFLTSFLSVVFVVAAVNADAAQSVPACAPGSITISRTSLTIDAVGTFFRPDSASVLVVAPGNCTWTVTTGAFVTIWSGRDTYTETVATVQFVVGPNSDILARSTTITINGLAIAVIQRGRPLRTAPMDLDGDGRSDLCTRTGVDPYVWLCNDRQDPARPAPFRLGGHPDQMVPADYNGDHIVDAAAFRPSTGEWFILEAGAIRTVKWGIPGDIPVPADYDGDGKAEVAVYRPSTGDWYIPGLPRFSTPAAWWQSPTPVPGDYNGDGRAEPALFFRSPNGSSWYVQGSLDSVRWGQAGDIPVPGDYDGNGTTDFAVFRPATGQWFIKNVGTIQWGAYGDIPLPLDVYGVGHVSPVVLRQTLPDEFFGTFFIRDPDGSASTANGSLLPLIQRPAILATTAGETGFLPDRRADITLYRPGEGAWYLWRSSNGFLSAQRIIWGLATDQPVGADFAACIAPGFCPPKGYQLPAVFRDGLWYRYASPSADSWGTAGDVPVPGDYLGTNAAQLAVYRPSSGVWYVQGMNPVQWGQPGDIPIPADYDGDGRLDIAIWRPSTGLWAILCSSGRASIYQTWGLVGDIPVPADYDGDGRADFALYRPSAGAWAIFMQAAYNRFHTLPMGPSKFLLTATFGDSTSVPVPADYDGDGITDIATWTPGTGMWSVRNGFSIAVGVSGDIPVVTLNR